MNKNNESELISSLSYLLSKENGKISDLKQKITKLTFATGLEILESIEEEFEEIKEELTEINNLVSINLLRDITLENSLFKIPQEIYQVQERNLNRVNSRVVQLLFKLQEIQDILEQET
ncbi:MAG: hypothetical protein ACTSQE_13075 [Candidatus Heimdallarchaeaceae archaeon]